MTDNLVMGLTSMVASAPVPSAFEGGCLPCQQRMAAVDPTPPVEVDPTVSWEGVIGVEGEMTGDGRLIEPNALRVYDLPIPLRYVASDVGAHDGAVVVGTIDEIERQKDPEAAGRVLLYARGRIDLETEFGAQAARGLEKLTLNGVSMDLDDVSFEVRVAAELAERMSEGGATVELGEADENGHVKVAAMSSSDEIKVTTSGRIRAATIVSIPAFAAAKLQLSEALAASALPASQAFNWVDDAGGLPQYIKRISDHLREKGMDQSHAIATAVNVVKKMCATGDVNFPGQQQVNAGSQAEACDAVADWEAKKAKHSTEVEEFAEDGDEAAEGSTVAENVEVADPEDGLECAFPECEEPATLLVPRLDDPAEEVDPEEEPAPGDPVPYCPEHGEDILEEIGEESYALGDLDEEWALDEDVLTQLFTPEEIAEFGEHYEIVHAPAGTAIGGQFISPGTAPAAESSEDEEADQEEIDNLSKLSAKALAEVLKNLQSAAEGMSDPAALAGLNKMISHVKTAQANVAATASKAKSKKGSTSSKGTAKAKKKGSSSSTKKSGGSGSSSGKSSGSKGSSSKSTGTKKAASSGSSSKSGSAKSGTSTKKSGASSAAAKAAKSKAVAEAKAKREAARKAKAEATAKKTAERKAASDKAKADRIVSAAVKKAAAEHAKHIKETKTELASYYKKFNTKLSPEERGAVQDSIDKLTDTLKELERQDAPTLTASAAPEAPPAEWFTDPHLNEPTPLTITDDGRIYGHLAAWNTCHTSHTANGQCVLAPRSASNYAYFHTGAVRTAEGSEVPVGHITMDARHAKGTLSPAATMSHYEDTGTVIADVASGEDSHGIWFSGALRPWATEKQIRQLRSSPLSGDWRRIGSGLELVAALAVNVPGFPIPRPQGLVAGGALQSLVASGMIEPQSQEIGTVEVKAAKDDLTLLSAEELEELRTLAAERRERRRTDLLQRKSELARKMRVIEVREKFARTTKGM